MTAQHDESYWKENLTPDQYHVLREKGTEAPFTGDFVNFDREGIYTCAGCGTELFRSDDKFDTDCGWPSFDQVISSDAIQTHEDTSHGMCRIEVTCATCDGHLGHVFPDGPRETTGERFCINSVALNFKYKKS
jgi:peptide-methionine (R)-S-oxide reductase